MNSMRSISSKGIRRPIVRVIALGVATALAAGISTAQPVDVAAYERADRLRTLDPYVTGGRVFAHWLEDGRRFHYRASGPGIRPGSAMLVEAASGSQRLLFNVHDLAKSLADLSATAVNPDALPGWTISPDASRLFTSIGTVIYSCALPASICQRLESAGDPAASQIPPPPTWAVRSPDGQWDAFVWNHNVYIRPARLAAAMISPAALGLLSQPSAHSRFGAALADNITPFVPTGQRAGCDWPAPPGPVPVSSPAVEPPPPGSIALTSDGNSKHSYGRLFKLGAEVATLDVDRYRPIRGALAWSPDSSKILTRREDIRGVGVYPLYSSTSQQPVDHSYYYAAPGATHVPQYDLYLLDVAARSAKRIDVPPVGLIQAPGGAEWSPDSKRLSVLSSDRGIKEVRLSEVDVETGKVRTIIREISSTSVEMSNGGYSDILALVSGRDDVIWFSERDGWGHLYRYDKSGRLKNQIEQGNYSVAELTRIDAGSKQIYFTAYGKAPGVPYYRHLYRVDFDGSGLVHLTPEAGDHYIQWSPDGRVFLDTQSAIDEPPVTVLRRADGSIVSTVSKGSDEMLRATGWRPAEVFTVKARDGVTDLYGILHRPSNFDPAKRYPIITNVYPGPFTGSVGLWTFKGPDNFEIGWERYSFATHGEGMGQSLAELGFIVIKLDALGTARRSKAIRTFFYGDVIDNGLPDQIAAIRQLGQRYPWIDTERTGIFGHSGGGFAAAAGMLRHPDVFKVGVAQSGNQDFRSYGWYFGERFQGLAVTDEQKAAYARQATYQYAADLKGKLLLMHGDMDCNNPPAQTLRLVDALVKNGKNVDLLIVPDAGHQLPDQAMKQSWDYFVRYLRGESPPEDFTVSKRPF